jgi:anti-anti-sigma factor
MPQAEPDIRAGQSFGPAKEEQMPASHPVSEHPPGAIRVVPETAKIVALCLEGDFDLTNAPALDAQIDLALDRGNDLILDLSKASFIDSSVIHLVARAAQTAETREHTVVLQLGTAAIVERVLEVARIEEVLPRAHDRQEALRMIRQQTASV